MPYIKKIECRTVYGLCDEFKTILDCSKINGLEEITMYKHGVTAYNKVKKLRKIWMFGNKDIQDMNNFSCSSKLQDVTFLSCSIKSLEGIENYKTIDSLTLWHNYSLKDISSLKYISNNLKELNINACSKIKDFSVLKSLYNLEYLCLDGNNKLPNLDFLKNMKKLKVFTFTMNVDDGNLNNCMNIPFVYCKNRKHYNLKDKQLPKNLIT